MGNKSIFKTLISVVILGLLMPAALLSAQTTMKLVTDKGPLFEIGDIFEVDAVLDGNSGTYGVFLDLRYNNTVFELLDIQRGNLLPDNPEQNEMLVARSPYNQEGRVLLALSQIGDRDLFYQNGRVARFVFKAVRSGTNQSISLDTAQTGIYQQNMQPAAVLTQDLSGLNVLGPYTYYFIQIVSPYNNYKTNVNKIDFLVQSTIENPGFNDEFIIGLSKVTDYFEDAPLYPGTQELQLAAPDGYANFTADMADMFTLSPGYNNVVATLYVNGEAKAKTIKRVYYEALNRGVFITHPADNTITGKSIMEIAGESSFERVTLNNILVRTNQESPQKYSFVQDRQKLKEGFNKITARTFNPEEPDVIYTDTITVYYQRDESIFEFIAPENEQVFKSGPIKLMGVIDTMDKELVRVKMRAHFKPYGIGDDYYYAFKDTDQVDSQIILRELEDSENFLLSHYIFETEFDLSLLDGLGSGVLTFYAVKTDKLGDNQDIEIACRTIVDREELKIELQQPNLFSQELFADKQELVERGYLISQDAVEISDSAGISLIKSATPKIYDDVILNDKKVKQVVVTADGSSYAVANGIPNRVEIFRKDAGQEMYSPESKRLYYNAYANCAVEYGSNMLLLGISDYNMGEHHPSGLLMLSRGLLRSAKLPFPINHVQYIKKSGTRYFLYASNYTYLYVFDEADVVISRFDDQYFQIRKVKQYYLPNNLFINDFLVLNQGHTIALATELGLRFYQYNPAADVYAQKAVFKADRDVVQAAGAALQSGYSVFLFAYKEPLSTQGQYAIRYSSVTLFQQDKFREDEIVLSEAPTRIYEIKQLKNNSFLLYGQNSGDQYVLRELNIFYGLESDTASFPVADQGDLQGKTRIQYLDRDNYYLYGQGLKVVTEEYLSDGSIEFAFSDVTVDGLTGFSFDAPLAYNNLLGVEYLLTNDAADNSYLTFQAAGRAIGSRGMATYSFNGNDGYKYLKLRFHLYRSSNGLTAPFIENLTLGKKEIVKSVAPVLDLRGFIRDKTVGERSFTINSKIVPLEKNGSFFDTINLNTAGDNQKTAVRLYTVNNSGESDEITFSVSYVAQEPVLEGLTLRHFDGQEQDLQTYPLDAPNNFQPVETTGDKVTLMGSFKGLYGVQVSVELYTLNSQNDLSSFIVSYNGELRNITSQDGEISGDFIIQDLELIPGNQRLLVRCMNPYGTRKEVKFDLNYTVIDEKIVILNYTVTDNVIDDRFQVRKAADGRYLESFELLGKVLTSNPVDAVNLRSDNPYISFTKGDQKEVSYIKLPLSEIGKRFSVFVNIKMEDDNEQLLEYFKIWPDSLQLAALSRNIYLQSAKQFRHITPDFSPTRFDDATGVINLKFRFDEAVPNRMLLRFRFNHQDLGAETTYLPLTKELDNEFFSYADGVYTYNNPLQATDGLNIIDWWFYQDMETTGSFSAEDILLSLSDLSDYLRFQFNPSGEYEEFAVTFPDQVLFYDAASLTQEPLDILFDARGSLTVFLNNRELADLSPFVLDNRAKIDLSGFPELLQQGLNSITVHYQLESQDIDLTRKSTIKYDSQDPEVRITAIGAQPDFVNPYVDSLSVEVTESNLERVYLIYNGSVIDHQPTVKILASDHFLYQWDGLTGYKILPGPQTLLYAEAVDVTGKTGRSRELSAGSSLYYDIRLSNKKEDTKVLNYPDIVITGTNDPSTDYSAYRNEQDGSFDPHLKYEATKLEEDGTSLREDITNSFSKERVFNSSRKYLMFEFDSPEALAATDLGYTRRNVITKKAALTPVNMLQHQQYTHYNMYDAVSLGTTYNTKDVYSRVRGYATPETQYLGNARDVKVSAAWNLAFVLDLVDSNRDGTWDYRAIVVYDISLKIPEIVAVLDYQVLRNLQKFRIKDNYLYAVCGTDGVSVFEIPKIRNEYGGYVSTIQAGDVSDVVRIGNYLYVATLDQGFKVYLASDLAFPTLKYTEGDTGHRILDITEWNGDIFGVTAASKLVHYFIFDDYMYLDYLLYDMRDDSVGTIKDPKIWNDSNGNFHVLPRERSYVHNYKYGDGFTDHSIGEIAVNNKPVRSDTLGLLYPGYNILIGSIGSVLAYDRSYGLAVYGDKIYSAAGKKGLRVIAPDNLLNWDFVENYDASRVVNNWSNSTDPAPFLYLYLDPSNVLGTVTLPIRWNPDNTASHSYISQYPNTVIKPQGALSYQFLLFRSYVDDRRYYGVLKFSFQFRKPDGSYHTIYKQYMSETLLTDADKAWVEKEVGTVEFVPGLSIQTRSIDFSAEGLPAGTKLAYVSARTSRIFSWGTGAIDYQTFEYINSVYNIQAPVYRSFDLPLTHAALKIDKDPGYSESIDVPLNLFDSANTIVTKSGKVLVYFPLDSNSTQDPVEEAFNQAVASGVDDAGLVPVEYDRSNYFDLKKSAYITGQVLDDQVDKSWGGGISLAPLNTQNLNKFEAAYNDFFKRRSAEGLSKIKMGKAEEELILLNPPAEGSYKIYLTDSLIVRPPTTGPRITEKTQKVVHLPRTKNGALSFWFRLEDEIPWFKNYAQNNTLWKDYNSTSAKPLVSWGGAEDQNANYRFVVYPREFSFIQYKAGTGIQKGEADIEADNRINVGINNSQTTDSFYGNWHLATLTWDQEGGLVLYMDNTRINMDKKVMYNFDFDKFLDQRLIFGDVGAAVDSLYYSVAAPKVFNHTLTDQEVAALFLAGDRLQGSGRATRLFFDGNLNMIKGVDSQDDISADTEVYEETLNNMGFVATAGMVNYISSDFANDRLLLTDKLDYSQLIRTNVDATYDQATDEIMVQRQETYMPGYYHMTDGGGSGLDIPGAESYTFFGTLLSTDLGANDVCIIKINGIEKSFPLRPGDFKFTYSGVSGALNSIDIYFQFEHSLRFKASSLGFNLGRYAGNNLTGYPSTELRMRHQFHYDETVVLYYQPLFANGWELNNEELVILDSRLYKIGISGNKYYAVLKTREGEKRLTAGDTLEGGLHQLVLRYDFSSLTFKFYVDAKLQAAYSGDAFSMPFGIGQFPDVFNMTPGGSMDGEYKAQGILDELSIYPKQVSEKELQDEFFNKSNAVAVLNGPFFDTSEVALVVGNNLDKTVAVTYSVDDSPPVEASLAALGQLVIEGNYTVGEHVLSMDLRSGSLSRNQQYCFFVNYAPLLKLVEHKPIIIRGDKRQSFVLERSFQTSYAEKKEFIELRLYLSEDQATLDDNLVQVIKEDRLFSNYGKYFRDDDYTTLSEKIAFELDYQPPVEAERFYYKITAFYYQNGDLPAKQLQLSGQVKILDITEPIIQLDQSTGRPWIITTGITGFNPDLDSSAGLLCNYTISRLHNQDQEYQELATGSLYFNALGKLSLNVYSYAEAGNYKVRFDPTDESGNSGFSREIEYSILGFQNGEMEKPSAGAVTLEDLSPILTDTENRLVKYNVAGMITNLKSYESYDLQVVVESDLLAEPQIILNESGLTTSEFNRIVTVSNLVVGGRYTVRARVTYKGSEISREVVFRYQGVSVDVRFTHGAVGFISYNNVYFNWRGLLDNNLDSRVKFRYRIDNSPWGEVSSNHIEFYNLDDGAHQFTIQGFFGDSISRVYSTRRSRSFFIDTKKPLIDESKLHLTAESDDSEVKMHLKLIAEPGSITDSTLAQVTVNGETVTLANGGFVVEHMPLDQDGDNLVRLEAVDILGNVASTVLNYRFDIIEITYPPSIADLDNPQDSEFVKYSPLTVYGRLSSNIAVNDALKVYVDDPYGRRYATINFDRSFFIENVKINPGTKFKGIKTNLLFTTEFANGKTLSKEYPVFAKDVIKPVELDLSVHAVSGGADTTEVKMTATTDVENVLSWSFDYDGDGVFDDEYFTNQQQLTVFRKYSYLGMIHPRVRVITQDNHFFSGEDTLIIHDKIIKADIKDVPGALSLDILEIDSDQPDEVDGYEYVFILGRDGNSYIIKRFVIEANSAVLLDNNSVSVNLNELGINYPRSIKADANGDIYVATLYGSGSRIYKLQLSSGAYVKDNTFNLVLYNEVISSFDIDPDYIYITSEQDNGIMKYDKQANFVMREPLQTDGIIEAMGSDAGVAIAADKLWIADYKKQRVLSAAASDFKLRNFFGEPGNGEGQFISPKLVRVLGSYIYVLDASEKTIQVFEQLADSFRIVCRIDSFADYIPLGFLNYVTDFAVFTKLENKRVYHYLALINNDLEQVALLRIPQWEPNSVRVKSNLITYVRNNEIFTSKPDGADARKIFSSGSLPGVDGNVDYPTIAPDGAELAFVSRIEKYEYIAELGYFDFRKYDKLYLINVDGTNSRLVDDPLILDKEIERPQFSFDGTRIIFSAKGIGEFWAIYEYDISNNKVSKLFEPTSDAMRPTYSPDDRYVAYVTRYNNHNEIVIYDSLNPDLLIPVTNNDFPDDYPVWAPVYPGEIADEQAMITSKIAFMSKPDFTEGVFYTYISQRSSGDLRVVKKDGSDIGGDPDAARNQMDIDQEATGTISYPCFTANGDVLIFETYKLGRSKLMQYDMQTQELSETGIPGESRRPSGMKNRITGFSVQVRDGNDLSLTWNRFAKEDLVYTVEYISSESDAQYVQKSFKSQDHALIEDLKMGLTFQIRVFVKDMLRGGEITTSIWKRIVVPPVVAKPTITIDPNNPYLVHMEAWKPETDKPWEYKWKFKWIIDNYALPETFDTITEYEFGTAGIKRIALVASLSTDASKNDRSEDAFFEVLGDLTPVIDYKLIEETNSVSLEMSARSSTGSKIDRSNYKWKLSGSNANGNLPPEEFAGETVIRNLENYRGNVYLTLTVSSLPVIGQLEVIREEQSTTIMIPLGLNEIKPVITETINQADPTLYTFSGASSVGNIDWTRSTWEIFGPDNLHYKLGGQTEFSYQFPQTNTDTNYTVVLNALNKATALSQTANKMITVGKVPIQPSIDYKVLTSSTDGELVTAKLLLSAASSRGNNIDWNDIRWNVPLAGDYGGLASQSGAAVVYNLYNIKKGMSLDVYLTMHRRDSSELLEVSELLTIEDQLVPEIQPYIEISRDENEDLYSTAQGDVYIFSALRSKGPNIDWNNVSWLIDDKYERKGAVVRLDMKDSGEDKQSVVVTLTLNSTGGGTPVSKTLSYNLETKKIRIVISKSTQNSYITAGERNIAILSVRDSIGRNIDWERTRWFIYQGPENIVEKFGAEIVHAFPVASAAEYYPVIVHMFYQGSARPFVKRTDVRVKGDRLVAMIKEEYDEAQTEVNKYTRTFSAADSAGENIDWQNCMWTFGDSSAYQYGPVVTHKFPFDRNDATYKVTLTISRKNKSGEQEIDTDTYRVSIGRDELEPYISVVREGDYVVFSAEESTGRGLLLDRSMWVFEGADSENVGSSATDIEYEEAEVRTDYNTSHVTVSYSEGPKGTTVGGSYTRDFGFTTSDTFLADQQIAQSAGESSNNIYTGAVCRKMVDGWTAKRVTLVVYRALPDGTLEAMSKTFIYRADQSRLSFIK